MSGKPVETVIILTWLSPIAVVTIADPNPVVTLTLMPPIMLHTMMYHNMLFLPYLGMVLSEYSDTK